MDTIISRRLSSDRLYAYHRNRFWLWDDTRHSWNESHLMSQKFEREHAARPTLTPADFMTDLTKFQQLDEFEIDSAMLDALKDAKPCKAAPIKPVEELPPQSAQCSDAATAAEKQTAASPAAPEGSSLTMETAAAAQSAAVPVSAGEKNAARSAGSGSFLSSPAAPTFDFSALGDLSGQAAEADQQFDLHYGTAQDEYLISCIYLARVHALTAKAGRYGGGTWTKWYESKGIGAASVHRMLQTGEGFKSSTMEDLKCLPELTRKDLNLIARSGCAEQLTAAAGDSQRVQDLLAQIKAEKERADAAEAERDKLLGAQNRAAWAESHIQDVEAQRDAALADVQGLTEQNAKLQQSYHDADESRIAANLQRQKAEAERDRAETRAKDAENQLEGSRQVAEAAKLRGDKLKAENDALKSQPITAVVDEEEVDRRAGEKAYQMAAEMTAELQAKLNAVTGDAEQDVRNAYDSVLLASRSMLNTWQMVKPQFCKLPQEQREAVANQLIRTLGQIQGEVSQCL